MSVAFNTTQQNIVDSNYKKVSWLFTVTDTSSNTYNWSNTQTVGINSTAYNFKITGFGGITTQRSKSEFGIQAPNTLKFNVINKDNDLTHTDFINGTVKVELLIADGIDKAIIRTWTFNIKKTEPSYQKFALTCEDYIQKYLTGSYPNTRFIKDIFFGDDIDVDDNVCLPVPFGKAYIPLRSVYIGNAVTYSSTTMNVIASTEGARCKIIDSASGLGNFDFNRFVTTTGFGASTSNNGTFYCLSASSNTLEFSELTGLTSEVAASSQTLKQGQRYYVLGSTDNVFTINKVRSPREWGLKSEWHSSGYTFNQSIKVNSGSSAYRVVQPIIADADFDGTADSAGLWKQGDAFLDMPAEITRSDTSGITNPGDVISFFLQNIGIPSTYIDNAALIAASTIYDGWSLSWNGAHWFKESRSSVLSKYLNMCHSYIVSNERLELKVKDKTSKKTITKTEVIRGQDVGEGSFKYNDIMVEYESDSGYVAWNSTGESQDKFLKILVPSKGISKTIISDEVLPIPFVQNSQHVQALGTLYYQRKLKKQANVSFKGKGTLLGLEPEDVITINDDDYGGNYDTLIDSIKINTDCSMSFKCIKYSVSLDNFDDLSPDAITIFPDDTGDMWTPPISGPLSVQDLGRQAYNIWGQPWVIVGPSTNEGKYTSIQSAINALEDKGNNGIFLKNGEYRTTGIVRLPNRDISIIGESKGGVIVYDSTVNNSMGVFKIADGSSNVYSFENFTMGSYFPATTKIGGIMLLASTGKPTIYVNNLDFRLDNTGLKNRHNFIDIAASSAIVSITNCNFKESETAISISGCASYKISNCNMILSIRGIVTGPNSGLGVINSNNMDDIGYYGIYRSNLQGKSCNISNNNINLSTSFEYDGHSFIGIRASRDADTVIGNNINIRSDTTIPSYASFTGILMEGLDCIVSNNNINININAENTISGSTSGNVTGITIISAARNVVSNNNITIDVSESTRLAETIGIQCRLATQNIISSNYINCMNDDAVDIGINFGIGSEENQGSDNITYKVGTSIVDLSTNYVTARDL